MGDEVAAAELMRLVHHVLDASDDEIDEKFIGTMRPALAGWPAGWTKPERFDEALLRLSRASQYSRSQ
jgi:hypothetical protein